MKRFVIVSALIAVGAGQAAAQEALLPTTGWGSGFSLSAWHFAKPLPQTNGGVADVVEISIPFRIRSSIGSWSWDLSGAGAVGAVHFKAPTPAGGSSSGSSGGDDEGDGESAGILAGPTDVKLRISGPIVGDATRLTLGFNLPVGKAKLTQEETGVLQVIGAPALRFPVASFGTGSGVTVGVIRAFESGDRAFALGASVEQRSEYTPVSLALSAGQADTKVTPGTAIHLTAGLDQALGESRLNAILVADVFSKDKILSTGGGLADASTQYQLGPQLTASARIDLAASRWRDASLSLAARMRSEFSDSTGNKVTGSSGTYFEAAWGGVRGGPDGAGFIIGTDFRWHSGLKFTDAMVGAATTAAGLTIGVERAGTASLTRFFLHGQYGTFDTGTANTTGMGLTIGFSVSARREAK